jgi:hypothetical protein
VKITARRPGQKNHAVQAVPDSPDSAANCKLQTPSPIAICAGFNVKRGTRNVKRLPRSLPPSA